MHSLQRPCENLQEINFVRFLQGIHLLASRAVGSYEVRNRLKIHNRLTEKFFSYIIEVKIKYIFVMCLHDVDVCK